MVETFVCMCVCVHAIIEKKKESKNIMKYKVKLEKSSEVSACTIVRTHIIVSRLLCDFLKVT